MFRHLLNIHDSAPCTSFANVSLLFPTPFKFFYDTTIYERLAVTHDQYLVVEVSETHIAWYLPSCQYAALVLAVMVVCLVFLLEH